MRRLASKRQAAAEAVLAASQVRGCFEASGDARPLLQLAKRRALSAMARRAAYYQGGAFAS